jgi:hypothetical protein
VQNDVTAAASGESLFGAARTLTDFLFFHLGARLHSRLILKHQIYNGNSPLSFSVGVLELEAALEGKPELQRQLWALEDEWPDLGEVLPIWRNRCAETLVNSVHALTQFVEIRTVVLSSFVPIPICQQMCDVIEARTINISALVGKTSPASKAIGAAGLPFSSRFMVE